MMKVFKTEGMWVPVKRWADMDDMTRKQIVNAAGCPAVFHHVALMPDAHGGYGVPIGSVVALRGAISPNMVGVDIGCGMCAAPTTLTGLNIEGVKAVIGGWRKVIPVGFTQHKEIQPEKYMTPLSRDLPMVTALWDKGRSQLGTLGGGNHFFELQSGSDGRLWLMVHSGSRKLGYEVAKYYNALAKKLNERWYTDSGTIGGKWYPSRLVKNDLAILPIGSEEAKDYIDEMKYCLEYSRANRRLMMFRAAEAFERLTGGTVLMDVVIDVHHNYAVIEHHFNRDVWVHRKGAIRAREGDMGIIPGSQGTKSYITKGKGNADSFNSCAHGAGRRMGRKQAKRELDLAAEQAKLEGIVHSVRNVGDLDEAAGAYKDIGKVMRAQEDLVEIVVELTPLGVMKG